MDPHDGSMLVGINGSWRKKATFDHSHVQHPSLQWTCKAVTAASNRHTTHQVLAGVMRRKGLRQALGMTLELATG